MPCAFELHFSQSSVPQACVAPDGSLKVINAAFRDALRLTAAPRPGSRLSACFAAPERSPVDSALQRAANAAQPCDAMLAGDRALSVLPILDEAGGVLELLVTLEAKAKLELAAMAKALADYETLVGLGPAWSWWADAEGRRLPAPTPRGERPSLQLHPADQQRFLDVLEQGLRAGAPLQFQGRWVLPSGGFEWFLTRAAPMINPTSGKVERWLFSSMGIDALVLDADQRQRQLDALERQADEQRHFAAFLAHELAAPIRGLASVASMLIDDLRYADLGVDTQYAQLLHDRAQRSLQILENVEALARCQAPKDVGRYQPERVLDEVLRLLSPGKKARVDVVKPMPELEGSPSAFQQVMTNLIGNAIKHGARNVMVVAEEEPDAVRFVVDDDGPGIPLAEQQRVWDLFHSTQSPAGSLGVGLGVVKRIVESHGGTVALASAPGHGTRFSVTMRLKR